MKKLISSGLALAVAALAIAGCAAQKELPDTGYDYAQMSPEVIEAHLSVEEFVNRAVKEGFPVKLWRGVRIDTLLIDNFGKNIQISFNENFARINFRENTVDAIYDALQGYLSEDYSDYNLTVKSMGVEIYQLVPNFYRSSKDKYDQSRIPKDFKRELKPVVRNVSKPYETTNGLYNKNIGLWHSHGWYYANREDRWEWQRTRTFQTVEDVFPMTFTIPYIIPMLQNAGANVFVPRELDLQTLSLIHI